MSLIRANCQPGKTIGAERLAKFVAFEIAPCKTVDEGNGKTNVAVCDPEDWEFWTVYGRHPTGEAEALHDSKEPLVAAFFLADLATEIAGG